MYFKRLDMHGFKSFAEPVSIEFTEGVTCIVGPNGSGKSNISDAIRWVLGEQSPKALRGGKMDEVIFAGTASRKSRGMAEVTLTIDNADGMLPIDYSEVAITRRMYRSGESEYLINGNHCRLKDIRELIMDTGIGVDGYSLIGQGKIADIVANKTESRREIFEEAAGIVMYRTKKAESERKLAASMQNLERVNDVVAEIEGRIDGLRADSIKAKEYVELRDKYRELEINISLQKIDNLDLSNEYMKDEINELEGEIENLNEDKEEIDAAVAENRRRAEELESLYDESNKKLLAAIDEINMLSNRSQVNNEKLSAIDQNTERLTKEIAEAEEKLQREEKNEAEFAKSKEAIDKKLEELDAVLNEKINAQNELAQENAARLASIDDMKNEIFNIQTRNNEKRGEKASLAGLKANLDQRKETLSAEISRSGSEKEEIEQRRAKAASDIKALDDKLTALRIEQKKAREEAVRLSENERVKLKELEETKLSIGQKTARKRTIEEMENNYEGYNNAVKFIMRGGYAGICGVVAELMEVPKGYETAIETALGAGMQNIVCEKDADAKKAIEALKANRAGRLTFLPLESVKGRGNRERSIEGAQGFKGFGTDCIKFDKKYEGIFEYLLGRVVVVDNMDSAIRMSKQAGSLRYVTLEGEIINAGGAITGGKYRNNTANLLERKAEITRLGEELDELNKLAARVSEELAKTRTELGEANVKAEKMGDEATDVERQLITFRSQLEVLESAIRDTLEGEEKRNKELDDIEKQKGNADNMILEIDAKIAEGVEESKRLEEEIEKATAEAEIFRGKLTDLGEEITKARIDVTAAEGEKATADQMAQRIRADIDLVRLQVAEKVQERENLLAQRTTLTGEQNVDETIREKEDAREALEKYIAELAEEKATVSKGLNADSARKDEIDQNMKELQDKKFQLELKAGKQETQLENLKERLWNEFEVTYLQAIEFKKHGFNMAGAERESRKIKARISELGEVNVGAIKEYASVSERYEFLTENRKDILEATESLKKIIEDMDKTITERFTESFDGVVANFDSIFKELFGGGHAELRLDDEAHPLESGIDIIAQPPGKKLQNINLLSGGEKTMTAIALMFAVLKHKPTPFCILDEVEAALDDANIDRFSNYLRNFNDIQFALVTHQKATMEHADVLYGVTMPEHGVSRVISLKLGDEFDLD